MAVLVPSSRVMWSQSQRVIATRLPSVHVFDNIAPRNDWDDLERLANLTSPRVQQSGTGWGMFKPEDCASGAGASLVMAPFAYLNPDGSRFTDGTYGAYYAARNLQTAIRETVYHTENFARDARMAAITFQKQVLVAQISGSFHDLRKSVPNQKILSATSYAASQLFARKVREDEKSKGIVYPSVRSAGGECIAVFLPRLISDCRRAQYLDYAWDGKQVSDVFERSLVEALKPKVKL